MSKPVLLVTGADLAQQALAILTDFEVVYAGKSPDEPTLVDLCRTHEPVAMIVRYGRITPKVIAASPRLRVISKHGSGIDTIDTAAAAERGVAVVAAVGANAAAVAEHTWALILACAKDVVHLDSRMRAGHWDKAVHKSLELNDRTLGLIGLGAIGRRVAQIGLAFGMRIVAHDPFVKAAPAGVEMDTLDGVLARADVVSLHCPLTADNRGLINRDTIARMRDGAILVNTARGGLVDEASVIEALRSGKLRGAGLDSFSVEPLTGAHVFQKAEHTVITPHVGGVTSDAYVSMGVAAARNVLAALGSKAA